MMWGTNIGETRAARSAEDIQRRLATATVVIVGTGLFGIAAGDLGSVETFPIVLNVAGIPPGIYHFDTVLDIQECASAGFIDDVVDRALGLDGLTVGRGLGRVVRRRAGVAVREGETCRWSNVCSIHDRVPRRRR